MRELCLLFSPGTAHQIAHLGYSTLSPTLIDSRGNRLKFETAFTCTIRNSLDTAVIDEAVAIESNLFNRLF